MGDLSGEMEVWQSNKLVEAAQAMTLNEKRLVIAAAALHDPRKPLPRDGTVKLHADDFADVFGIQGRHVYEALKDASERLFNRRIRTIADSPRGRGKRVITDVRWVWLAKYNEGEGSVTLGFSPGVAEHLTLLRAEFTRYKLKQIGAIGSFYGLRIYELCAQYRKIGKRSLPLAELRQILDLGEKYERIETLRRRVLDPAVVEINQHTDLRVTIEPERKGRKIVGFCFTITQDDQLALALPDPDPAHDEAPESEP
jgi:Protein involved in initiation of plasmid replication